MKKGQGKGNQPKGSTKRGAEEPAPSKKVEEVEESADNGAPKKIARTASPPKKVQKVVKESEDDVEVVKQDVKKTDTKNKKPTNGKKAAEQEREDEDESEVGDDEATDDNQQDDNGEEENGDEEDDSDAPTAPSKIKYGPIPIGVDPDKVIHVAKLPKKCKNLDIVEAFKPFGNIIRIHVVNKIEYSHAFIQYKTGEAASAAVDDKKAKIRDFPLTVTLKDDDDEKRKRTVYVRGLKDGTTKDQVQDHFKNCGKIELTETMIPKNSSALIAFVTFVDTASLPNALELHNSILNGINIKVFENVRNRENKQYDENLTILLRNKENIESYDYLRLKSIFSECGEIDYGDVICRKNILAFLTFKTPEAATKALAMNGQTVQDLELEIELYSPMKKWTSIHIINIPRSCTEEDLKNHFAKAGEIVSAAVKGSFGVVRFADSDGYCKSFLFNESFLKGHMIFIEPHSVRKVKVLQKNLKKTYKRTHKNGQTSNNKKTKKNN